MGAKAPSLVMDPTTPRHLMTGGENRLFVQLRDLLAANTELSESQKTYVLDEVRIDLVGFSLDDC